MSGGGDGERRSLSGEVRERETGEVRERENGEVRRKGGE